MTEIFVTYAGNKMQLVTTVSDPPRGHVSKCRECSACGASGYCSVLLLHTETAHNECIELCPRLKGGR
ncbi:MAG: hypothetical protein RR505_12610 [Raoultibacter sp.]